MLTSKTVILGVTGSIAAYKMANVASMLVKMNCDVHVIMTKNATHFINPITFETLTNNKCMVDTFDRNFQFHVAHVSIAKKADVVMIAPASANIIAKLSYGLADDMLSTTVLATTCPKIIVPAMNTNMLENSIVQENLERLTNHGMHIVTPETGMLACRDVGSGKMPSEQLLVDFILREIALPKDLKDEHILVTAGPTQEAIDPVRFITNHSSGKMGYAIAKQAMLRGAKVTLVSGPAALAPPPFVDVISVVTADEMFNAVTSISGQQDIIIKAAAVADYRPSVPAKEKLKKNGQLTTIDLEGTKDILLYLGEHKLPGQILCGFSMETENLIENSKKKLLKKNLDMVAANCLKDKGAGFKTDTNRLTLIMPETIDELPLMTKDEAANRLLTQLKSCRIKNLAVQKKPSCS